MDGEPIRLQLARIVADPLFGPQCRLSRFLTYIVEETLAGRAKEINSYPIGLAVFDRSEDFDPQTDSIVRVEAVRLRSKLKHYYETRGKDDPLVISIPVGRYIPHFEDKPQPARATHTHWLTDKLSLPRGSVLAALTGIALAALTVSGFIHYTGRPSTVLVAQPPAPVNLHVSETSTLHQDVSAKVLAIDFEHVLTATLSRFRQVRLLHSPGSTDAPPPATRYLKLDTDIHRHDNTWYVAVRSIDAESGEQLFFHEYDLPDVDKASYADITLVARKIATAVTAPSGPVSAFRGDTVTTSDGADENCIHRAVYFWKRYKEQQLARTGACLERALQQYPDSAIVWAAKSFFHLDQVRIDFASGESAAADLSKAAHAASKAYSLDPDDNAAVRALYSIYFVMGDLERFSDMANRAIKLNPDNAYVLADVGRKLAYSGNWSRGIAHINEALKLTTNPPGWFYMPVVFNQYRLGNYDQALHILKNVQREKFCGRFIAEAVSLASLGKINEARHAARGITSTFPKFEKHGADLLAMWNFEPQMMENFRSDLARAGIHMAPANRNWRLAHSEKLRRILAP